MELTRIESKMVQLYESRKSISELDMIKMVYGWRLLVADFKKIIVVYAIAILLGCFLETILVHLSFIFIRQVAFGIHSDSFKLCLAVSTIVFPSTAVLLQKITINQPIIWSIYLLTVIILLLFAPIGSKVNAIRGTAHYNYLRKKMFIRLGFYGLILFILPVTFSKYIVAGLAIEGITILISLIKKGD